MEQSPRLSLSYVMPSQAQKHVTVNETFRRLDALVQLTVISRSVATEPANPSDGDGYILPSNPSGAHWGSFPADALVVFQDGGWSLINAIEGLRAWVSDDDILIVYDGTSWATVDGGAGGSAQDSLPRFGVNGNADNVNRLTVKSDAILFSHDDVTPGSGDARQIINKKGAGEVASVLFQNAFSGRAECGIIGDDDFRVQVSGDGASFIDAALFDRTSGAAFFPAGVASIPQDNMLVNGGFDIWQRGTVNGPSTTPRYCADRWFAQTANANVTLTRETLLPGDLGEHHSTYFLRMQMNNAASQAGIDRREEAPQRFMGRVITYSFWARADIARNFNIEFFIAPGAGGSQPQSIPAGSVSVGTNWEKFEVTAEMPSTNGFSFGTDGHFEVRIRHGVSAAFRLDVAQAKLEPGPVATPFVARDPGREMSDCTRYFWKLDVAAGAGSASAGNQNEAAQVAVSFPSPMRTEPATTSDNMTYSGVNINAQAGLQFVAKRETAAILSMRSNSAGALHWQALGDIMFDADV